MLKDLIKVANKLDSLGLTSEADFIDSLAFKIASHSEREFVTIDRELDEDQLNDFKERYPEVYSYLTTTRMNPATRSALEDYILGEFYADKEIDIDSLQAMKEEYDNHHGPLTDTSNLQPMEDLRTYEEPPVDIEDVKAAFISQFKDSRDLDTLKINSIRWETEPSEYPHYKVKAMGTYRPYKYRADDYFHDEPVGKGTKVKEYPMNIDFWLEPDDEYPRGTPVTGTDGNTYYFYGED